LALILRGILRFIILISTANPVLISRHIVSEFAEKVLQVPLADVQTTLLYRQHTGTDEENLLFKARVQAYATNTWKNYIHNVQGFINFCANRSLNVFECTPYIVNLYLLHLAQSDYSYSNVQQKLTAISFLFRFFLVPDPTGDQMVSDVLKFVSKVTSHVDRKKSGFGSAEVRKLWDKLEAKFGAIESMPLVELRTFVMIVTQHATLCRYSDIQNVKLSDVLHEVDYFEIHIGYSKTDQSGIGQIALLPRAPNVFRDPHQLMCCYLHKLDSVNASPDCYLFPPLR
jgi:integrase